MLKCGSSFFSELPADLDNVRFVWESRSGYETGARARLSVLITHIGMEQFDHKLIPPFVQRRLTCGAESHFFAAPWSAKGGACGIEPQPVHWEGITFAITTSFVLLSLLHLSRSSSVARHDAIRVVLWVMEVWDLNADPHVVPLAKGISDGRWIDLEVEMSLPTHACSSWMKVMALVETLLWFAPVLCRLLFVAGSSPTVGSLRISLFSLSSLWLFGMPRLVRLVPFPSSGQPAGFGAPIALDTPQ